ncbi:sigma-70 family RNA polymerase sigma factor [Marinomonas rhizomae]|uniref:RNA polymerase sigma-70 factor (ECF subfamily) n=1 Tax=Marinomonas rhizomae TaxID=491948 RepID=A0A366IVQ4_9GAMM|nr:sigma-70 family RNA polymerase sigma factor [Marinomonas rhizomae]RBP78250.1 RNA polymerase sigma-70 factor (ECF subfamily) [Marinomonas rhizomae]RNF69801.1 sigma-70 family RNA polymerase sigma factor [Marinomonas rhizomae]
MPHNANLSVHHDVMHSLYINHHNWLYAWIRKRLDNQCDAADLTQDTFLRIHAKQNADTINEPKAYLATIAKGLVGHFYRRKSLEQAYLELLAEQPESFAISAESKSIILQTLEEIDALLSALPSNVKQVFLMSIIEGKKYQQIADEMNLSLATVKRYMKQAYVKCFILMESNFFE